MKRTLTLTLIAIILITAMLVVLGCKTTDIKNTKEPTVEQTPEPTPTPTPESTATPLPEDCYIDDTGNIPTDVHMLYPPFGTALEQYCIVPNENGEFILQEWVKYELTGEWNIPKEMFEVGAFTNFKCGLFKTDVVDLILYYGQDTVDKGIVDTEVSHMQKDGKEITIIYNSSSWVPYSGYLYACSDGSVYFVYTGGVVAPKFTVYYWKFEPGVYVQDTHLYESDGTNVGDLYWDNLDGQRLMIGNTAGTVYEWDDITK